MRHKNYSLIVAWAEGAEIEYLFGEEWLPATSPYWNGDDVFRIKPKRIKKEGWVNVYSDADYVCLYETKESADIGEIGRAHV